MTFRNVTSPQSANRISCLNDLNTSASRSTNDWVLHLSVGRVVGVLLSDSHSVGVTISSAIIHKSVN